MKFLIAALMTCAFASPALAQALTADRFEGNDWWLVQPGGADSWNVISNGQPRRSGDSAVLWLVALFSKPQANGATGVALSLIVRCTTRTTSRMEPFTLDANGDLKHNSTIASMSGPMSITSPLYRFACTDDRTLFTHFEQRDRRAVIAELLARNPDK
ncbi:hypothetical protein FHR20_002380 [Sphingomonas leidyi]|uniref:Uncharacterized protein n=1 Tax=Sphingomonas leidyi TaxID=68569 RepID=A0A7X5V041_9SPHN|nr:hypothetical protein [Sphingomonas leidyi]NIJ65418.1 hypothetical protein [Sphingomonas leidyi]